MDHSPIPTRDAARALAGLRLVELDLREGAALEPALTELRAEAPDSPWTRAAAELVDRWAREGEAACETVADDARTWEVRRVLDRLGYGNVNYRPDAVCVRASVRHR